MPRRFIPLRRSSPFRRSRIFWILVCIVFLLLDMTISLQESANRSSRRELEDIWMSSPIRPSALVRLRKRQAPLVHFKKMEQHTPRSEQVVLSRPATPAPAPFCSMEQYTKGKWQERGVKPQNLADIRNQSSLLESAAIGCHPLEWPVEAKGEVPLDHPDHLARLLESAQWQWVPEGDCRRHEIDVSQMVKRLLRSKGGLVIVGDSLSEQHFAVIQNILVYPGGPWDIIGYGDRPRMAGIKLNPDHPLSAGMLAAAGVRKSRCDTPIVTLYLERHLISREEMDGVMDFASDRGYTPFSTGNGLEEWVSKSIWFDEYSKTLSGPAVEFVGEAKEEKTVLLLNSGAHWVNGQFTREMTDFYPELLRGWDNLIDLLNAKIATLPLEHQQVIWRATSPGHPHCEFSSTPEDRTDIRSKIDPSFNRYNWEIFDKYNAKWEEKLSPLKAHERSEPAPIMEYLDIWPISVTRPDAHLLPPNDCLHFCYGTGGVIEEWQKLLWHKMMGDARNADYASQIPVYR